MRVQPLTTTTTLVVFEAAREEGGRNPNLGERRSCHVSSFQWTLKWSKLVKVVKSGQIFKSSQRLVKEEGFN